MKDLSELSGDIVAALGETAFMVIVSLIVGIILGISIGLLLYLTSQQLFLKNKIVNTVVSIIINIVQSIPFLILMIFLLPLSKIIVGTKIGPEAVVVPLSVSSVSFLARLSEASFASIDKGIIEAGVSSGASKLRIIFGILIPEALPDLIRNITVTTVTILGFSAMAGLVGGGGLGDLAYRYGYQRYQTDVMVICVIILIVLVQIIQITGSFLSRKADKKN